MQDMAYGRIRAALLHSDALAIVRGITLGPRMWQTAASASDAICNSIPHTPREELEPGRSGRERVILYNTYAYCASVHIIYTHDVQTALYCVHFTLQTIMMKLEQDRHKFRPLLPSLVTFSGIDSKTGSRWWHLLLLARARQPLDLASSVHRTLDPDGDGWGV